jgi:hypothetical protein
MYGIGAPNVYSRIISVNYPTVGIKIHFNLHGFATIKHIIIIVIHLNLPGFAFDRN